MIAEEWTNLVESWASVMWCIALNNMGTKVHVFLCPFGLGSQSTQIIFLREKMHENINSTKIQQLARRPSGTTAAGPRMSCNHRCSGRVTRHLAEGHAACTARCSLKKAGDGFAWQSSIAGCPGPRLAWKEFMKTQWRRSGLSKLAREPEAARGKNSQGRA